MILDELDLSNTKKFREYASIYSSDDLLDALNQCKDDPEKRESISKILKIQQELSIVLNEWNIDVLNLKTLLDRFYANSDPYSLRNSLIEIGTKDPELTFKLLLLKSITSLLESWSLSEDEWDLFDEFKIDSTDTSLLNNLKYELVSDLNTFYSLENWKFIDISTDDVIQDSVSSILQCISKINEKHSVHNRLEGKKIMPWHCAFNDSPKWLSLHGEDVVEYDLWDEYIPWSNHVNSLELVNKIYNCNISELEELYRQHDDIGDLEYWKSFYKNDEKAYKLFLLQMLSRESINLIKMFEEWDYFLVVKGTYKDKEIFDFDYINCWYVDVRSMKTWKIYRVLSD